jgi:hypothetical protein
MSNEDPINHAGIHINRVASLIETTATLLCSDLVLLHKYQTKQGKPKKVWYRQARKQVAELRQLLEMAEEDLQEVGKAWKG